MARHAIVTHRKRLMAGAGAAVLATVLGAASATGTTAPGAQLPSPTPTPSKPSSMMMVVVKAEFEPASAAPEAEAVTYDTDLVPEGSEVWVKGMAHDKMMAHDNEVTRVHLRVKELVADHTYGVHVHTDPCGVRPTSSGPHYQHRQDPEEPSVDSKFANTKNEVWLDFTTDENGTGKATAKVDWQFRAGEAQSVVIHESDTETRDGRAGTAGDRVACVNVPFG
ncbi:superoxide dismutase family protein [Streptomyces sp. NPDC002845]